MASYIKDPEGGSDSEVADLFRRAQGESRKRAEEVMALLRTRLG